jgi:hypothetical protein
MKAKEQQLLVVALCALIAGLALIIIFTKGPGVPGVGTGNPQTVSSSTTSGSAASTTTKGVSSVTLSYNDALALYGNFRFQFIGCHGTPGSMNVATNVTVMLDNRDAKAHTVKVGPTAYAVGAYGFRIVRSPAKTGTYPITCDGGGAATLNVK